MPAAILTAITAAILAEILAEIKKNGGNKGLFLPFPPPPLC